MKTEAKTCYQCNAIIPPHEFNLLIDQEDKFGRLVIISKIVVQCKNGHRQEVSVHD